jgi:two-component system alkaline phosphatase synthesis response regulator PhoP
MPGLKILVADDEAHILHIVTMKLRNAGFEVITAVDGEEAMELVVAEKPNLLITDNQMPFLTGLDLCKKLRQSGLAPNLPIIMLTARGHDLDQADIAAAGISDVLAKPFSPREVLEKVIQRLGQKPQPVTESPK